MQHAVGNTFVGRFFFNSAELVNWQIVIFVFGQNPVHIDRLS